jgi:energy-coupling factor transport system substrate-specific component
MKASLLSIAIYLASLGTGLLALLYPFFLPALAQTGSGGMRSGEMPFLMTLLLGLCLLVLLYEVQGQGSAPSEAPATATVIALLGVLVAINSALRFIETAVPGPGGFTPIFFLIITGGYVFGGRFGFLLGALTMLVSALVTGGVGPWLPNQMFTAGWLGMSAAMLRYLIPHKVIGQDSSRLRRVVLLLAVFGFLWGFLYGAIMNLWEWPFIAGPQAQSWQPGQGVWTVLQHYAVFYAATSLVWDAVAALGNTFLLLMFGAPTLRALRRFQQRFSFQGGA